MNSTCFLHLRIAVVLAIIEISSSAILQHALIGSKSKMIEMIERGEYAAYVKYPNDLRFSSNFTQMVYESRSYDFLGNITVGTPEQQFTVLLDTGSADFWIPGSDCISMKRKFESNASSTFMESNITWHARYEAGEAEGVFGIDVIKFGGLSEKQLTVPNTTFGLAKHMSYGFGKLPFDGILGLAFTGLAFRNVTPPLINAINQGLLGQPLFTVWLQQRRSFVDITKGVITYGAIDTTNCGKVIAFEPLTSATYYQFKMSAIQLGSHAHRNVYEVISDTGATSIYGPKVVTDWLAEAAGAVYNATYDLYMLECRRSFLPALFITIGREVYPVLPNNYIFWVRGSTCALGISPYESGGFGPPWTIGIPFIHQYCHIYDIGRKKIGFAPSLIK